MTLSVFNGGGLRAITSFKIKIAGVMRTVRTGSVYVDGVLHPFYSGAGDLAVSANDVSGFATEGTVVTETSTATPTGGTPPYSYAWSNVSHSGNTPGIVTPSFASTQFTQTGLGGEEFNDCTERVTVTDAVGATATADITATFRHVSTL